MTTETKPKNKGILNAMDRRNLELAGIEIREREGLPWEVDLRVTPVYAIRRWPDIEPRETERDAAIRAAGAALDWQSPTLRRFVVGYEGNGRAGWLLLEAPPEDWESWARQQARRILLAVHLYDERTSGRETKTRCGLAAFDEYDVDYGPGRQRRRKLNVWSGSELSRRQDAASWEEDDEAALDALERRLCPDCGAPENAEFPR